jgi:RimJ/RimL family protein N-acetyltransferase
VPIPIETPRLLLRAWRDSDREPFARMNADPQVMEFFPACLTREQSDGLVDRIEANMRRDGYSFFAAELRQTGEFIGFIGLSVPPFDFIPSPEIGWRLAAPYWNQGLATEGARAALRFAFDELGYREIIAYTAVANIRSRRVMEKLGMTYKPADDFDHPRIAENHPLRRHALYRIASA